MVWTPFGSVVGETYVSEPLNGATVSDMDGDVTTAPTLSVMCRTIPVAVPALAGVPLIEQPDSVMPEGNVPANSVQVYGAVPP